MAEAPPLRALAGETVRNEDEIIRTPGTGELRNRQVSSTPVRDSGGRIIGSVSVVRDVTDQKKSEAAVSESEGILGLFSQYAPAAIAMLDTQMRYVAVSERWLSDYGFKGQDLRGRNHYEVFPEIPQRWKEIHRRCLAGAVERAEEDAFKRLDGSIQWTRWEIRPWHIASGAVGGIIIFSEDITGRKKAEEAFFESRERLQLALAAARMASFEWDMVRNKRTWDDNFHRLFGTNPETFTGTPDELFRVIHPEDRTMVSEALSMAVETGIYEADYRIVLPDGGIRHIAARGKVHRDGAGRAIRLLGVCWDVTENKKKENELHQLNRTLEALRASSRAMSHALQEQEYMEEVCRIVVRTCGHAMVWIGFAEKDDVKSVRPVAHAGFDEGYLDQLRVTWAENDKYSHGPTGTAIRTGKPAACLNIRADPAFGPWREPALKRGYASSIALPLMAEGRAFGAVTLYSKDPGPFSEDEVKLLKQLADDLAYGITTIRLRLDLAHSEEKHRKELETRVIERTSELQFAVNALETQMAERQRLEREILEISEREKSRLGQDLHDGLCQSLAGIACLAKVLQGSLEAERIEQPVAAANAAKITNLLREAINEARNLAMEMYPVNIEEYGIAQALDKLATDMAGQFRIRCEFKCAKPVNLEDNRAAAHVYRITQEAIGNAVKHGKAESVVITLASNRGQITLKIEDNGDGRIEEMKPTGMGLKTMNYRARSLRGSLELRQRPRRGIAVICSFPNRQELEASTPTA